MDKNKNNKLAETKELQQSSSAIKKATGTVAKVENHQLAVTKKAVVTKNKHRSGNNQLGVKEQKHSEK